MFLRAPVASDACTPKSGEVQLRVWFEIDDRGPKVSVSMPGRERSNPAGVRASARPKVIEKEVPIYPRSAIVRRIQGARLIANARVDTTGQVTAVAVQNMAGDAAFVRETERALKLWKFDVSGVSCNGATHFCVPIPISFHLGN